MRSNKHSHNKAQETLPMKGPPWENTQAMATSNQVSYEFKDSFELSKMDSNPGFTPRLRAT